MKIPFVDLKKQYQSIQSEIDQTISQVLNEAAFVSGRFPQQFEQDFSSLHDAKHCISVANGTDAIFISLKMLGIGHGDEVITTACSWISTSEAISQTGATPVFVDIDDFHLIDSSKIEEKITSKTKAILPVHLYGQMADVSHIHSICTKHQLLLIEDCAQAHFAEQNHKKAGLTGIAGTFSFYPGKNLGAYGDAGCILTNDDEFANKCRQFANHGGLTKHEHLFEGINSRMDGIQAAILSTKLPYLNQWTKRRQEIAKLYCHCLKNISELTLPQIKPNNTHVFHLFVIELTQRTKLQDFLTAKNIETAIHYPTPLPLLPCYNFLNLSKNDFPVAVKKQNSILSLPIYPELTNEEVTYICDTIKLFYKL